MRSIESNNRVDAVDVLRGLAVLLLFAVTSGARCVYSLPRSAAIDFLRAQLRPSAWHGLTLADLCFPLFLFVAGVSLTLSWDRRHAAGSSRSHFVRHVLRRGVVLYAIGWAMEGFLATSWTVWAGPLQQLAVSIVLTALVVLLLTRWQARLTASVFLLAVYGLMLAHAPSSGPHGDRYGFLHNLAAVVESQWLPGTKHFVLWDPHGFVTTIPACALVLAGSAAGTFLIENRSRPGRNIISLTAAALVALNLAVVLNQVQPWNPHLNTPAFLLAVMGMISFMLALLLTAEQSVWLLPLRVLGRNSLLSVGMITLFPLTTFSANMISGTAAPLLGGLTPTVRLLIELGVIFLPAYALFRWNKSVTA